MKIQLKKELLNEMQLPSTANYSVSQLNVQDSELNESITHYLTEFTQGILDPDIANSEPSRFVSNLVNNRLGDFSKCYIELAYYQKQAIGIIIALPDKNNIMHIYALHISPNYRRNGIASLLLIHFLNKVYYEGVTEVILDVHKNNYPAYNLYKKIGFIEI